MIRELEYHPVLGNQRSDASVWTDGRTMLGSMLNLPRKDHTTVWVRMSLNRVQTRVKYLDTGVLCTAVNSLVIG